MGNVASYLYWICYCYFVYGSLKLDNIVDLEEIRGNREL